MILEIIEKERAKVLELRTKMGLHRLETDKHRWERWEITVAKLMALDSVSDALLGAEAAPVMETPENLTGKKSILDFIVSERVRVGRAAQEAKALELHESRVFHRAQAEILEAIFYKLSGSAGTQPKTSEEDRRPMGTPPVTVADPTLPAIEDSSAELWLETANIREIEALSEACLVALEARGAVVHWSLSGM